MKIGHLDNKPLSPALADRKATAPAPLPATLPTEASAQVALSPTVTQLVAGGKEGVFDSDKVQRISDAIRDGQFKINPGAIADKLIANAQELLGNTGSR